MINIILKSKNIENNYLNNNIILNDGDNRSLLDRLKSFFHCK